MSQSRHFEGSLSCSVASLRINCTLSPKIGMFSGKLMRLLLWLYLFEEQGLTINININQNIVQDEERLKEEAQHKHSN